MTPETYSELLKDLQKREKTLVPAYLATLRADPALMERLQGRFESAEIGGRFDDFAVLCCRRSAVQFLLRTVYVRVLEDLGALEPAKIRGEWGLAAFREVAPALGVREFLKWTFRDLARDLPALFNAAPEELPLPSEELCRETWDLWHRMSGDKPVYAWASDTFDSRFLGNLYQDLDAEVRKRFALLQTPDFVEKYILDHTLTPALKEFDPTTLRAKGECFRIIDPTCGSGHFLIGAFHRLADYWQDHGVKDPWDAAQRALESVWGCDINPHAVDIARFRLMLEVHARTGVTQIEKLASLTFNLRTMDSLIPWERGATKQAELFPAMDRLSKYATPGERTANAAFLHRAFHAVVGNPPYITPKDPQKRADYRVFWPHSASKHYALSAPFVERFLVLGCASAFVGQVTANSFMKREFGTTLVHKVFSAWELTGVVDSSGAFLPGHGTPTVILFMRSSRPTSEKVWTISGKRGEPRKPAAPALGLVWTAIAQISPKDEVDDSIFVTSSNLDKARFLNHPWNIGTGAPEEILVQLESCPSARAINTLAESFGYSFITNCDPVFLLTPSEPRRFALPERFLRDVCVGDAVRDYTLAQLSPIIYPYDKLLPLAEIEKTPLYPVLWRYRTTLFARTTFSGGTYRSDGRPWFEWHQFTRSKHRHDKAIAFAFVATHNHFSVSDGPKVFNRTSPIVKFPQETPKEALLAVCGLLNSSTLAFWMRSNFHDKGNGGTGGGIAAEDWERFYEYDATKLQNTPIVAVHYGERLELTQELCLVAQMRAACLPQAVLQEQTWDPYNLEATLATIRQRYNALTHRMVALQEELDWLTYGSYQLIDPVPVVAAADIEPLAPGHRPFEILFARADDEADADEKSAWWSRHGHDRVTEIPPHYSETMRARIQARMDLIEGDPKLQLIEQAAYKRRWQTPDLDAETKSAAESYLLDRLEDLFAPGGPLSKPTAYRLEQIADAWSRDPRTKAVARVWKGGDVDLTLAAEQLLRAHGLPDNPRRIYTAEGLRTLAAWQKTWALQDLEDQGKPLVDPDTDKPLDTIESPPKFDRTHFQSAEAFSIRGKLNVPRERFIVFADLKPQRYGWNGWRDTERALAQVDAYSLAEADPQDPLPPPTAADPRRCGLTLGLWDSLPDVRRWGDASTHAELLALAQEVCGQKSCPCDVVDAWQAHQLQQQRDTRAKRPGRKASLPVVPQVTAPVAAPARPPADPDTIAITIEDRDFVFRLIEPFGEGGATIGDLARSWAGQPGLLARVLDDLIASGDLKTRGRGKKKTYIAPSKRRPSET